MRVLIENPAYKGKKPRKLRSVCHDGSPFLTTICPHCQTANHVHETQFLGLPPTVEMIDMRCSECRQFSEAPVDHVLGAFAQMRREGWIE